MTVQLPEYVGGSLGELRQIDSITAAAQATVSSGGTATVQFSAVDGDREWRITRAAIVCDLGISPAPKVRVYAVPAGSALDDRYLRDGTDRGLFDAGDYPGDGLIVRENEQLTATWVDAPVGARVTVTVQYRLMGRS